MSQSPNKIQVHYGMTFINHKAPPAVLFRCSLEKAAHHKLCKSQFWGFGGFSGSCRCGSSFFDKCFALSKNERSASASPLESTRFARLNLSNLFYVTQEKINLQFRFCLVIMQPPKISSKCSCG